MSYRASGFSGSSVILLEENLGLNAPPDSVTFPTLSEVAKLGAFYLNSILHLFFSQRFAASLSAALHHAVRC